jgi:hypothetical protein
MQFKRSLARSELNLACPSMRIAVDADVLDMYGRRQRIPVWRTVGDLYRFVATGEPHRTIARSTRLGVSVGEFLPSRHPTQKLTLKPLDATCIQVVQRLFGNIKDALGPAHPKASSVVLQNHVNRTRVQTVVDRPCREPPTAKSAKAGTGAQPQAALVVLVVRSESSVAQCVKHRITDSLWAVVLRPLKEALIGSQTKLAAGGFVEPPHVDTVEFLDRGEGLVLPAVDTTVAKADPDAAAAVLSDRLHLLVRQTIGR